MHNVNTTEFTTERLLLSTGRRRSLDAVRRMRNDPQVAMGLFGHPTQTPCTGVTGQLMETDGDNDTRSVVRVASRLVDGTVIGAATIRNGLLSYLIDPRFWGRGYGTELVRAMVDKVSPNLCIARLDARVIRDNEPSRRILERAGFTFTGIQRFGLLSPGNITILSYFINVGLDNDRVC